ncbi:MAG: hypothetical protein R3C28_32135 [Pirellulaceae bacterium]
MTRRMPLFPNRPRTAGLLLSLLLSWSATLPAQELVDSHGPMVEATDFAPEFFDQTMGNVDCDTQVICDSGMWPTYATYLKVGPSTGFADGFFENDNRVGWALSGGFREAFGPRSGPWFFDFGGSYFANSGRDESRVISGTFTEIDPLLGNQSTQLDRFFETAMTDLKRASAHFALGYYYQPLKSFDPAEILFSFRFGGRIGHAKASFDEKITDELQAEIDAINNPFLLAKDEVFSDTDTFGGLFLSLESALLKQDFMGGDLEVIADLEVANDWIEIRQYKKAGLGYATLMFGVTLRR